MTITDGQFATALSCIDGRIHDSVCDWMRRHLGVRYIDLVTDAGADKALLTGSPEDIAALYRRILISVEQHQSRTLAIVGHHDCAGNPGTKEQHVADIQGSIEQATQWRLPIEVLGLWVDEFGQIEVVNQWTESLT